MSRVATSLARSLLLGLLAVGLLLSAQSAPAQLQGAPKNAVAPGATDKSWSAALAVVPDNALGFVVLKNLSDADAKVSRLARNLQLPLPGGLAMIKSMTGVREGLDEKGAAIAMFLPGTGAGIAALPTPIVLIPVTDYTKFIGQFAPSDAKADVTTVQIGPSKSVAGKRGNYAAFAPEDNQAELKAYLAATKDVVTSVAPLSKWFGEHDLIAVAMPSAIKMAIAPVRNGLEQAKKQMPADNDQAKMALGMFEMYGSALSTIESDVTHFGLGLKIDETGGLFVNSYSALKPGGELAKAAASVKRPVESALSQLGAGPYMMAFEGALPASWADGMMKMSADSMKLMATTGGGKALSDDDSKKMIEAMKQSMAGVESMGFVITNFKPGQSMYDTMSGVMKVADSQAYLKNYEKSMKEMTDIFKKSGNKLFSSYAVETVKIGNTSALAMTMDMSAFTQAAAQDPNAQRMMDFMFGKEAKITAYLAAADKTTVVMAYDKETFASTLEAARAKSNSLISDATVAKTLKLLPSDSQYVMFVSPAGMIDFISKIAQNFAPAGQVPPFPAFPQTPAIGFGAKLTSGGLETSMVVPGDTVQGIGAYIQQVQAMMMRGPGGAPGARPGL